MKTFDSIDRDDLSVGERTNLERLVLWAGVVGTAFLCLWISTNETWNLDWSSPYQRFNATFYSQQALALLNGRLDVPSSGFEWTECFTIDGRCYGYFGLTPSILRIPIVASAGSDGPSLTPLFIALAIGLAMWALLDLFLRLFVRLVPDPQIRRTPGAIAMLVLVLLLGPGSTVSFLAHQRIYHEAILWMIAFLLVSMNFVYRWIHGRRRADLIWALAAAIASTNARASTVPAFIVLGVGCGWILLADRTRWKPSRSDVGLVTALATAPAALSLGIMWLKVSSFTLPAENYFGYRQWQWVERVVRLNHGELQGIRFLPTQVVNLLRPDSLRFTTSSPWIAERITTSNDAITVWPIVAGGVSVEPFTSLTNSMFVPLVLTVCVFLGTILRVVAMDRDELRVFRMFIAAGVASSIAVLTQHGIVTRYLGDFFPLLAIGTVFAVAYGARALLPRPVARTAVATLLIVMGLGSFYIHRQLTFI